LRGPVCPTQTSVTRGCVIRINGPAVKPFRYGALALDEAFTDRKAELAELTADDKSGQDVVIFAPRRYGKSSLVWRASQELVGAEILVAQVGLMTLLGGAFSMVSERPANAEGASLTTPPPLPVGCRYGPRPSP